eukprot:TRINITY_DN3838_c0_g1_i4.p1 TRINITY_DN3838_c0_g1~~TRINITY_DN3838_c0_g1_i4.p1  ORF type:complete len:468 (+),score=205.59 TRINITY_DN3838_c0_g1_i4:46-1449(+)
MRRVGEAQIRRNIRNEEQRSAFTRAVLADDGHGKTADWENTSKDKLLHAVAKREYKRLKAEQVQMLEDRRGRLKMLLDTEEEQHLKEFQQRKTDLPAQRMQEMIRRVEEMHRQQEEETKKQVEEARIRAAILKSDDLRQLDSKVMVMETVMQRNKQLDEKKLEATQRTDDKPDVNTFVLSEAAREAERKQLKEKEKLQLMVQMEEAKRMQEEEEAQKQNEIQQWKQKTETDKLEQKREEEIAYKKRVALRVENDKQNHMSQKLRQDEAEREHAAEKAILNDLQAMEEQARAERERRREETRRDMSAFQGQQQALRRKQRETEQEQEQQRLQEQEKQWQRRAAQWDKLQEERERIILEAAEHNRKAIDHKEDELAGTRAKLRSGAAGSPPLSAAAEERQRRTQKQQQYARELRECEEQRRQQQQREQEQEQREQEQQEQQRFEEQVVQREIDARKKRLEAARRVLASS